MDERLREFAARLLRLGMPLHGPVLHRAHRIVSELEETGPELHDLAVMQAAVEAHREPEERGNLPQWV